MRIAVPGSLVRRCWRAMGSLAASRPAHKVRVVNTYPHDPNASTQGLAYHDGYLYEGTGLNGRSSLRKVQLETGEVLQQAALEPCYFGEGIVVLDRRILQLTWQSHKGFIYDRESLRLEGTFHYPGEGWGLATDGRRIFMSDGTAEIRCWEPSTLQETGRFTVRDGRRAVAFLNDLQYVRGELYANVWRTDRIVRISPDDGQVLGWIDLSGLLGEHDRKYADVLNGIAYMEPGGRLFVTGKLWPRLFEIEIVTD